MPHRLDAGNHAPDQSFRRLIDEHERHTRPRLERLWNYYRNALEPVGSPGGLHPAGRWYRLAQEAGLPARFTHGRAEPSLDDRRPPREIVVENDIAWRIHAMIDFMFGRAVRLRSAADDPDLRETINHALERAWDASGGITLLQDVALLGHVYGYVDLLLRIDEPALALAAAHPSASDALDRALRALRVEIIEPTRGIPALDPHDYRAFAAYAVRAARRVHPDDDRSRHKREGDHFVRVTEIFSPGALSLYHDDRLVRRTRTRYLSRAVPVVHIQNIAQPFRYEGLGEVEPLIPLQDELNTRLSDRANRVTLQSFKMYLAKGIEGFDRFPVGPGQIWLTDNPEASIQAFGADADSPGESAHILEIREALDKISGVPPLAAGVVRAKIGNLTSANALRVTLMGLITRTQRKRLNYGRGIQELSRLMLEALDAAGILRTRPDDRRIRIEWPDPIPLDPRDMAQAARARLDAGVPDEQVLAELGVDPQSTALD
ncbi:MAG: phage portal protein [Phycisphaeraceae bacterium]|nr:phage portal protein [Phycisphaeraceae bacterium]MCW5755422.1 phage portal protein [Phycisphaeraceae bacterium]